MIRERAVELARIGVDQQFVAVEPMPGFRRIWSRGAIAVERAGLHPRQIPVPHRPGAFGQWQAHFLSGAIR